MMDAKSQYLQAISGKQRHDAESISAARTTGAEFGERIRTLQAHMMHWTQSMPEVEHFAENFTIADYALGTDAKVEISAFKLTVKINGRPAIYFEPDHLYYRDFIGGLKVTQGYSSDVAPRMLYMTSEGQPPNTWYQVLRNEPPAPFDEYAFFKLLARAQNAEM